MRKYSVRFILPCLLILLCTACGNNGQVIATVNGHSISLDDYYEYLAHKPAVLVKTENGNFTLPVAGSLGFQAFRDLLTEQAELDLAKDKGLYPTDDEIKQLVEKRLKEDPAYLMELEYSGLTLDVIRHSLRLELAQQKLLTQGITVTDDEAKRYVKAHSAQFVIPEKVRLTYIFVSNKQGVEKVDDALDSGRSFREAALQYSESPTAQTYQGEFSDPSQGPVAITALPDEVQKAVVKLKEAESTNWLQFSNGYARFRVDKLVPPAPMKIDADVIDAVRLQLAERKGAQVHDINQMVQDKLKQSHVEIKMDQYKNAWQDENQQ